LEIREGGRPTNGLAQVEVNLMKDILQSPDLEMKVKVKSDSIN
jgi:hypothetical protein